jgi:hypothetical protein
MGRNHFEHRSIMGRISSKAQWMMSDTFILSSCLAMMMHDRYTARDGGTLQDYRICQATTFAKCEQAPSLVALPTPVGCAAGGFTQ